MRDPTPRNARTLHVLLVDGDRAREATLRRWLAQISEFGCDVVSCETGADALEVCRRDPPDVLLTASHLRDMSALELLFELTDGTRSPTVPVIVLTDDAPGAGAAALRLGAQDHLAPGEIGVPLLVRAIRYAIERHALLGELHRWRAAATDPPAPPERLAPVPTHDTAPASPMRGSACRGSDVARSILVVEHDAGVPTTAAAALEDTGIAAHVHRCGQSARAMDLLGAHCAYREPGWTPPLGLILVDLDLPGSDVLLREISASARSRLVPLVVLATSDEPADVSSCYRFGVNGYVRKPATPASFVDAIGVVARYWLEIAVLPRADLVSRPDDAAA